jgi:hypothetical protein
LKCSRQGKNRAQPEPVTAEWLIPTCRPLRQIEN